MAYKRKNYNTTIRIQKGIGRKVLKNRKTGEIITYYDRYEIYSHGKKEIVKGTLEDAQQKLAELEEKFEKEGYLTDRDLYQKRRREEEMKDAEKHIGEKFGKLTILSLKRKRDGDRNSIYANVKCDCGKVKDVRLKAILQGRTKSCGCLHSERAEDMLDKYVSTGTRVTNYKYKARNQTGVKGVYPTKSGTYRAIIWFKGKRINIGNFKTLEEATKARLEAEDKYFRPEIEEFNRLMEEEGTPEFKIEGDPIE